jgi:uncharacterized membrane protein YphA (DoxX/SURF4 family)
MKTTVQISRFFVSFLFIISGIIKANDPLGFSYKLKEYFEVFEMPFFVGIALPLAMVVCIFEIIVGVLLLIGSYVKLNTWLLLFMIMFFTWLTGYSALYNKVTDCGCFGDAIKLTPWQSFTKDLILLAFILVVFIGQKNIKPVFKSKAISSLFIFTSLFASTAFAVLAYMLLPFKDFLPYKVGNDIEKIMAVPKGQLKDDVYETRLRYRNLKTNEVKDFTMSNYPWQDTLNWKWDTTISVLVKPGYKSPIHGFKIYDSQKAELTDLFFMKDDYQLVIVQNELTKTLRFAQPALNKLAEDWMTKAGKRIWAFTSTPPEEAEAYRHEVAAPYEYFNMDGIELKTMIRSNPGVILFKKGVVIKKWSGFQVPTFETVKKQMNQ